MAIHRNHPVRTLLVAATILWASSAAAEVTLSQLSEKLSVSANLRTRGEAWNWFDPASGANDDYLFGATRFRFGATWKDTWFDLRLEGQTSALFSLPDDAAGPAPEGALGLGPVYRANNDGETTDASVFLHQAFIRVNELGVEGLALKGGRFQFAEGTETTSGDKTLDWLKSIRLSQRLIGSFDWAHVGRRYDGALVTFDRAPWNVTALYAKPTQGGFALDAMDHIGDIDLAYASTTATRPAFLANGDGRLFYVFYEDRRGLAPTDNRPLEVRDADRSDIRVHSFGGHLIHAFPTTVGTFDGLAWGLAQAGDWGRLDHSAWAFDFEVGWQPGWTGNPWFRLGYGQSSGDDDPADGDHETFFQILPTARLYSWSTFYNLMNNEDAFAMLVLRPIPGLVSRTDFHVIRLNSGDDLWYQGAGATLSDQAAGFGYVGRPGMGDTGLFEVIETQLMFSLNPNVSFELYYGHVFGGDVVRNLFEGDDADFAYVEMTLGF